ncbi:MAG: AAA family ATPase, partial [Anaerolineales bacterium]|nr:AAA family ATPase [Anaerolineales bacterium]
MNTAVQDICGQCASPLLISHPPHTPVEKRPVAVLLALFAVPLVTDEPSAAPHLLPALTDIAQRHHGYVCPYPHVFQAVFGLPSAHEDDVEQAVSVAHQMCLHLAQSFPDIWKTTVIGVSYGDAVVARVADKYLLQGDLLQQAAHMVQTHAPGQVWVTAAVQQAVRHLFLFQRGGEGETAVSWQLLDIQPEPRSRRGLPDRPTRFVGRITPLRQMVQLADNLTQRIGGMVLIEGEPGIGKSRLMQEFVTAVSHHNPLVWTAACSAQKVNQPVHLFSDLLTQVFQLSSRDTQGQIQQKIEAVLSGWPRDVQAIRPYLEMLLGIDDSTSDHGQLNRLEPDQLRQQTFVAIRRLFKIIARKQPLILLFDDLHWIDPISAELLLFLATVVASAPILFIMAQRRQGSDLPNDRLVRLQSLLPGQTVRFLLERLQVEESRMLVHDLFSASELPQALSQTIIERSEGNPYFIEEFVRICIEE